MRVSVFILMLYILYQVFQPCTHSIGCGRENLVKESSCEQNMITECSPFCSCCHVFVMSIAIRPFLKRTFGVVQRKILYALSFHSSYISSIWHPPSELIDL